MYRKLTDYDSEAINPDDLQTDVIHRTTGWMLNGPAHYGKIEPQALMNCDLCDPPRAWTLTRPRFFYRKP